jgi:hypothetical protein
MLLFLNAEFAEHAEGITSQPGWYILPRWGARLILGIFESNQLRVDQGILWPLPTEFHDPQYLSHEPRGFAYQ